MILGLVYLLALAVIVGAGVQGRGTVKGWPVVGVLFLLVASGSALAVDAVVS